MLSWQTQGGRVRRLALLSILQLASNPILLTMVWRGKGFAGLLTRRHRR